jgi:hypothetical protein
VSSGKRRTIQQPATQVVDLSWAVTTFTWLVVLMLVAGVTGDPDLWGHLRFGLDVLSQRALPVDDPYSFTQDRPILYHEWLGAVLLAMVHKAGGLGALLLLKLAVVLASFGMIWSRWKTAHPVASLAAIFIAALGALPLTRTTRPQMWTLLLLLVLVWLLQRPPAPSRLIALAGLFVAWINLHGGAIVGLGVVGVWSMIAALQSWRDNRAIPWGWVLSPVVAVLATLINPYGLDLWRFLLETVRPNRDITEWQPLWTSGAPIWVPLAVAVAATVVWRLWPSWPATAVLLLLWGASIAVMRITYIAVPATILLIAPAAAARWPRAHWQWKVPSTTAALIISIPLFVIAWAVFPFVRKPFNCVPIGDQDRIGVARLHATTAPGRVAVWFNWGQYALWHLAPRLKVSWDGRRETLYTEEAQAVQKAVAGGLPAGDQWLSTVRPEYVWLPASFSKRRAWLLANGYRLDHDTADSFIAVRSDLPALPHAAPFPECVRLE